MKISAIQLTSGDDIAANIAVVSGLVHEAADAEATLVCLPENTFYMRREGTAAMVDLAMAVHPGVLAMQALARARKVWIAIGSIRALEGTNTLPFNRSVLITPSGEIAAHYDKIHLFDVELPNGHHYRESAQAVAGSQAMVATVLTS